MVINGDNFRHKELNEFANGVLGSHNKCLLSCEGYSPSLILHLQPQNSSYVDFS